MRERVSRSIGTVGVTTMRLLVLLAMLLATPALLTPALAQPSLLAPLSASSFNEITRGVEALAVSGSPRAAPGLDALQAGRRLLGPDGALFIRDPAGAILDAETGTPASPDAA